MRDAPQNLRERLGKGALPLDKAMDLAIEVVVPVYVRQPRLHVACTRARDELLITGVGPASEFWMICSPPDIAATRGRLEHECYPGHMLNPTPPEALTDPQGRPYFLWDCDLTLAVFEERLRDPDPGVRAYFVAKLLRQAKPDDVFQFVTVAAIEEQWPRVNRYLGRSRAFWTWLLETWRRQADGNR